MAAGSTESERHSGGSSAIAATLYDCVPAPIESRLEQVMSTTVSGLRVYVNSAGSDLPRIISLEAQAIELEKVFYSRRGTGPIYRWLYEKKRAYWRPLRMDPTQFNVHALNSASWKSVPEALQAQLGQHYLD